jgi:hypothetical protein
MAKLSELAAKIDSEFNELKKSGFFNKYKQHMRAMCQKLGITTGDMDKGRDKYLLDPVAIQDNPDRQGWGRKILGALPKEYWVAYKSAAGALFVQGLLVSFFKNVKNLKEPSAGADDDVDLAAAEAKKNSAKTHIARNKLDSQLQSFMARAEARTRRSKEKISLGMLVETALTRYLSAETDDAEVEKLLANYRAFVCATITSRPD